ncbi:MAG: hypothetical protein LBC48_04410, partial [Dysgonamonadaceae bacterium]|nr:hypothetical protein [Dysgonamonadaceae bacterium]
IGSDQDPQGGAILDLSQVNDQDLGFLLPQVSLVKVAGWQLRGDETDGEGMLVYNINANTEGGNGKAGVYMWTGAVWEPLRSNLADGVQVTDFTLAPAGDTLNYYVGDVVTFTITAFQPREASYKGVVWTITDGVDKAIIDTNTKKMTSCDIKMIAAGRSTLTITSLDGKVRKIVVLNIIPRQ